MILLTGFGPFPDVADNPSAHLVRQAHGQVVRGHRIEGRILPVRWGVTAALPHRSRRASLVLGFGVARGRRGVWVERTGLPQRAGADVDGTEPSGPFHGAARTATVDAARLAASLGGAISDDAGTYLCNAWLVDAVDRLGVPTGFIHLPDHGMAVERLLDGLDRYLAWGTLTVS